MSVLVYMWAIQNCMMGGFSEEHEILYKGTWADMKGVKEALEWPANISKNTSLLPAYIDEISSDSAWLCL